MAIYDVNGNLISYGNDAHLSVPWITEMHRGYTSATVHENTLEAFWRAYLNGADWIECDARLSSDNVYVSNHDATVTVGGTTYTIASTTASVLTSLVLSTDPTYGECKLPTLESILKMCAYTGMNVNLDCKAINASTLAQLVVDCGMSGRVAYANATTANASTILGIDSRAGFIFPYSDLSTWTTALSDYRVRERSFAWAYTVSYEALRATRATGFGYLLAGVNSTTDMPYNPDMVEFADSADCKTLNQTYLNSLDFGL